MAMTRTFVALGVTLMFAGSALGNESQECQEFRQIYESGTDMCTTMWGDAFVMEDDTSNLAYYMGWFGDNPNFAISTNNGFTFEENSKGEPKCALNYYHQEYAVKQELGDYSACNNYQEAACCANTTMPNFAAMNELYGEKYHVDRCGPMSQSCQNFFMQESCLYECDPNAGKYRRYSDEQVAGDIAANGSETWTNAWELYHMPIKVSFCNEWYAACYNDMFCGAGGGNFFSCAEVYVAPKSELEIKYNNEKTWSDELTIVVVVVGVVCIAFASALFYVVMKEKAGHPVFTPLMDMSDNGDDATVRSGNVVSPA